MAYNSSKGPQEQGDIKFEGDPSETQIDFENDFIALKASGSQVLVVSGTHVGVMTSNPAAHPSEKNDFVIGNQTGNRGMTIASAATGMSTIRFTYATAANNGEGWIDYSNNSKKMRFGTNGLNTRLTISDNNISSSYAISASAFYANGVEVGSGGGSPGGSDGQVQYNNGGAFGGESQLFYNDTTNRLGVGTSTPSHTLSVSGSASVSGSLTVTGSVRGKVLHYTAHGFSDGGSSPYDGYLPFYELTDATNADYRHQMIAPFSGNLKKVFIRTANSLAGGTSSLTLYRAVDGQAAIDNGTAVEVQVVTGEVAHTVTTFTFTGSMHYAAGDVIGVHYNLHAAPGQSNATCIWEFDQE